MKNQINSIGNSELKTCTLSEIENALKADAPVISTVENAVENKEHISKWRAIAPFLQRPYAENVIKAAIEHNKPEIARVVLENTNFDIKNEWVLQIVGKAKLAESTWLQEGWTNILRDFKHRINLADCSKKDKQEALEQAIDKKDYNLVKTLLELECGPVVTTKILQNNKDYFRHIQQYDLINLLERNHKDYNLQIFKARASEGLFIWNATRLLTPVVLALYAIKVTSILSAKHSVPALILGCAAGGLISLAEIQKNSYYETPERPCYKNERYLSSS